MVSWVGFYGISTIIDYLMPHALNTCIFKINDVKTRFIIFTQPLRSGRIGHKVNFLSGV